MGFVRTQWLGLLGDEEKAARGAYLKALMMQLHREPFQPMRRRKPVGDVVVGWPARLESYFWPDLRTGYAETFALWQEFADAARPLSEVLESGGSWSAEQQQDALELAERILAWGRVPQEFSSDPFVVEAVFRSALVGTPDPGALMNSGWTKVAAFATAYREGHPVLYPQTIWDSRISTAVVSRLDALLARDGITNPQRLFPGIGYVNGRGGTRPRVTQLRWPDVYGRWNPHYAGSALVQELRNLLNASDLPGMPVPSGATKPWTIMGVGNVLFMDGY